MTTITLTPEISRLYDRLLTDLSSYFSRDGGPPTHQDVIAYAFRLAVMYLDYDCELTGDNDDEQQ